MNSTKILVAFIGQLFYLIPQGCHLLLQFFIWRSGASRLALGSHGALQKNQSTRTMILYVRVCRPRRPTSTARWYLLDFQFRRLDPLPVTAHADRRRIVRAHDLDVAALGNVVFHVEAPVGGIDEEAADSLDRKST